MSVVECVSVHYAFDYVCESACVRLCSGGSVGSFLFWLYSL